MAFELHLAFQREFAENLILFFFVQVEVEHLLRVPILLLILFCADARHAVLLPVVLQRDIEEAVVSDGRATNHAQLGRPLVRVVRPIAGPLARTPWIAQLEKSDLLFVQDELVSRNDRVCVAGDDTLRVLLLALTQAGCHEGELTSIS